MAGEIEELHIFLDPQVMDAAVQELGDRSVQLLDGIGLTDVAIMDIALKINSELSQPGVCGSLFAQSASHTLTLQLLRRHSTLSADEALDRMDLPAHRLRAALEYIEAHLCEDVSLDAIAAAANLSTFRFARGFRKATGQPPHQYVIGRRLERAKQLLRATEEEIGRGRAPRGIRLAEPLHRGVQPALRPAAQTISPILPTMIDVGRRRCALLTAVVIALPLWLDGCSTRSLIRDPTVAAADKAILAPEVTMYVVRRGWHIDLGFAASDLTGPLAAAREQFPQARFVTFGFGDRRYLHARNPAFPNMLAALWPGDGLLLVTALGATPQQAFGDSEVVEVKLSARQAAQAQRSVVGALMLQDARPQSDGPGPYEDSLWRSSLRYSAAFTCNTWAAQVLSSAGLPLRVHGVVFAAQVWQPLVRLARAASPINEPAQ